MVVIRILVLFNLLLLTCVTVSAQLMNCGAVVPVSSRAFSDNEKLNYRVSYSAALINMDVADVEFSTSAVHYAGRDCFKISAVGRTRKFFNLFFALEDKYDSWLDAATLRPLKAIGNLSEADYRFRSEIDFVWEDSLVHTFGENIRTKHSTRRTFDSIGACSYDLLSMFYNMRCANLDALVEGEEQYVEIVFEDTIRKISFTYMGREVRDIDNVGDVRAKKFTGQLAASTEDTFKKDDKFTLWITDDKNAIPVYVELPIRVGKVYVTLSSWGSLAHPFSSIVVDIEDKGWW